jgi:hypothetical protein
VNQMSTNARQTKHTSAASSQLVSTLWPTIHVNALRDIAATGSTVKVGIEACHVYETT